MVKTLEAQEVDVLSKEMSELLSELGPVCDLLLVERKQEADAPQARDKVDSLIDDARRARRVVQWVIEAVQKL